MNATLHRIAGRRRALVALAAEQRGRLAAEAVLLRHSLSLADLAIKGYRYVKSRPLLVAVAAAVVLMIGPRRLLRVTYRSGLLVPAILRLLRTFRDSRR